LKLGETICILKTWGDLVAVFPTKTVEKPWKNSGKTMAKPWKNHGTHGKTMAKQISTSLVWMICITEDWWKKTSLSTLR
jgi:hypothetical protein